MGISYKKKLLKEMTYEPKNGNKHKHNYVVECVLEITNKNIHATGNYYNKKDYYSVLKCDLCDSFIPNSIEGDYLRHISDDYNKALPLIQANTLMKCPLYYYNNLYDVIVNDK